MKELRRLKLKFYFVSTRNIFEAFFKYLKHFQHLKELEMHMRRDGETVDIHNQDLMRVTHLSKLTQLTIWPEISYVTLPGSTHFKLECDHYLVGEGIECAKKKCCLLLFNCLIEFNTK